MKVLDFSVEYKPSTQHSLLPKESHWRKCEVTMTGIGKEWKWKGLTEVALLYFFISLRVSGFFSAIILTSGKLFTWYLHCILLNEESYTTYMLVYAGVYNCKCYFCSLPNGKYTQRHLLEPVNKLFSRAAIKHIMKGNGRAIPLTIAWELLWTRCETIKILVNRILSVYPSMTKLQETRWSWLDVQWK